MSNSGSESVPPTSLDDVVSLFNMVAAQVLYNPPTITAEEKEMLSLCGIDFSNSLWNPIINTVVTVYRDKTNRVLNAGNKIQSFIDQLPVPAVDDHRYALYTLVTNTSGNGPEEGMGLTTALDEQFANSVCGYGNVVMAVVYSLPPL